MQIELPDGGLLFHGRDVEGIGGKGREKRGHRKRPSLVRGDKLLTSIKIEMRLIIDSSR